MNTSRHSHNKNRMTPHQHQLRLEAAIQPGETADQWIGRLHGMIARGHDGARQQLDNMKGSYAYQMYLKTHRHQSGATKLRSV